LVYAQPNPELVPLVPCNETACWFEGAWSPNGTLGIGEWAYFEIALTSVDDEGNNRLSTTTLSMILEELNWDATVSWYLKDSSIPSQFYYDAMSNFTCCALPVTLEYCNLQPDYYYIGVQNSGNVSATYLLQLQLRDYGGCPDAGVDWIWIAVISVLLYVVTPLACIAICCCICCCVACKYKNRKRYKYKPINDPTKVVPHTYQPINGISYPHPPAVAASFPHPPSSPPPQYAQIPVTYAYYPQNHPVTIPTVPVPPAVPTPSAPVPPQNP